MNNYRFVILLFITGLSACQIVDISQKSPLESNASEMKAKQLLAAVVKTQGFEVLEKQPLYQYTASDHWPGMMGKMTKLWPEQLSKLHFQYHFNTFDGKVTFLDGKEKGKIVGLQSWQYYTSHTSDASIIKLEKEKGSQKYIFGLTAFQYFNELAYRLQHVPILRYYGSRTLRGKKYDLVFASWQSEMANKDFDQYIVWINTETKLIDYCIYTVRENKGAMAQQFYGSIAFQNYQEVGGLTFAKEQMVFMNDKVLTINDFDDYFHKITIDSFTVGSFKEGELYPYPDLSKKYDAKWR